MNNWEVNKEDLPKSIVVFDELLCGCGNPQSVWEILYEYLENTLSGYQSFSDPFKLLLAYIVGYCKMTEHGTSIYGAWLTEEGKIAFEFIKENKNKMGDLVICY